MLCDKERNIIMGHAVHVSLCVPGMNSEDVNDTSCERKAVWLAGDFNAITWSS